MEVMTMFTGVARKVPKCFFMNGAGTHPNFEEFRLQSDGSSGLHDVKICSSHDLKTTDLENYPGYTAPIAGR